MSDENNSGKSKTAIFCGSGAVAFSVIISATLGIVSWYFCIGILWFWYIFVLFLILIAVQVVFMFFLKNLALIIQPLSVVCVVLVAILIYFLGTRQVLVAYNFKQLSQDHLKNWKVERKVYIFFEQGNKLSDKDESKENLKSDDVKKILKDAMKKNKEDCKKAKKSTKMETIPTIELQGIKSKKDAENAINAIKKFYFSSYLYRGFIVISGDGLCDYIVELKDNSILDKTQFDEIFKKQTGQELKLEGSN